MRLLRRLSIYGTVALTALSLAACGGTSQTSGSQSVVDSVREKKVLRVGIAPAPPYSQLNAYKGAWEGVVVDLANQWAAGLGATTEFVATNYGVIVAGLQAGRYDVVLALNDTPERRSAVTFSEPIVTALSAAAVIPDRDGIDSWESLDRADKTICTVSGSSDDATLTNSHPTAQILRLADLSACRLALQSRRANAVFDEWHSQGQFASESAGVKVLFPPTAAGQQGVSAALSQSATPGDLVSLNGAIDKFRSTGDLAASMTKWGAVNPIDFAVEPVPDYARQLAATEFDV
jgi:polar amino acid transport system substrate-binding protein